MAKITAINAVVEVPRRESVTTAFGVPGAAINPLYAAMRSGWTNASEPPCPGSTPI